MPATITPELAARQQSEIKPPQKTPEVPAAPRGMAAGTHPGAPIESDPATLAEWQGAARLDLRPETGRWSLNAWNQPVFIQDIPAGSGRRGPAVTDEPVLPPGQRGEDVSGQPNEAPKGRK